jgi:hypothetical protein
VATAIATKRKWRASELARNIHRLDVNFSRVGDEQRFLLMSDVHWDNPKCRRDKLAEHLKEAVEHDAPILDAGDFFCAMQGKWDKRSNKSDLRPEHQNAQYLDSLVDTAASFWKPYQHLLTLRGQGNHETAIIKRHETNLTERLVERLKGQGASSVMLGGYTGYVVFNVNANGRIRPFKMHYHHGHGGGGPVTRGVIQSNRHAVYLSDADIVWSGHTHDSWHVPIARVRLNHNCTKIEHTRQVHLSTAGYKDEYADGYGGWHMERGGPPKPIGAVWLIIKLVSRSAKADTAEVDFDLVEAK